MGLVALRRAIVRDQAGQDYGPDEGPEIPAHLDEAPPLQPRDADYTLCILFNPVRFRTAAQQAKLLRDVRRRYPKHLKWCLDPVSVNTLHGRMHVYSAYHTRAFMARGYVAEIESALFWPPKRSARSQQAWDSFFVQAVIVEAVIQSCRKLPAARRANSVFQVPMRDAVAPICGLTRKNDRTRGRNILCDVDGLLAAPRTFRKARTGYPADAVTYKTVLERGRARLSDFYKPPRIALRRRADMEMRAWSTFLGDRFSIDGLILWSTQTLALLRVQATDWDYREERGYLASGTEYAEHEENAQATKNAHTVEHLRNIQNDLRQAGAFIVPDVKRPKLSILADVNSILAGGIGLEDEGIWKDDQTLRESYSPQLLEVLAGWVSKLKRLQQVTLTGFMAGLIREMVTGELDHLIELSDDGLTALKVVRSQLPVAIWQGILNAAIDAPDHVNEIEVHYRWNDVPTDPVALEREGESIIIVGPLFDMRTNNQAVWARRVEAFRECGTLTI